VRESERGGREREMRECERARECRRERERGRDRVRETKRPQEEPPFNVREKDNWLPIMSVMLIG
jgi:hypothetical protein